MKSGESSRVGNWWRRSWCGGPPRASRLPVSATSNALDPSPLPSWSAGRPATGFLQQFRPICSLPWGLVLDIPYQTSVEQRAQELQISMPSTASRYRPSGPIRAQHAVAFETACDFTVEREDGFGRLAFHGIAEGVVTDRANAFGQRAGACSGHCAYGRANRQRRSRVPLALSTRAAARR